MMFENRYSRNVCTLSREECFAVKDLSICVIGCGGLGGYIIEMLGRLGIGHITAVDGDVFDETNLNRQLLSSSMNLGRPKTLAAQQRVMAVNPLVEVEAFQSLLTAENAVQLLEGCDVAVDALDNVPTRLLLQQAAKTAGIPLVHGAVAGWIGQVCVVQPGQDLLNSLYPASTDTQGEEQETGTLSFTAALTASWQAAETVKLLLGKPGLHGEILEIDLLTTTINKFKISE